MYMAGSILQSFFTLGCGLARNANEIILFRALSGVAIAFCLPSAVSIITSTLEGKRRNFAFAAMGGGQPVGFSIGLTLGGVLTDSIGWRWGFHLAAILNTIVFVVALWGLPASINNAGYTEDEGPPTWQQRWHRMKTEIDWIGAIIASTSLAMLSYVFATIAGSRSSIRQPSSIVLLTLAILLIPAFILWVGRQEKLGRPAIIPNSLWRNRVFTTICIAVFFTWGSFNALETIMTFYFQDVQKYSATQTSIYFLPAPIAGVMCNVAMGYLVHRVPANWLAIVGCAVSLGAPLAMVNASTKSMYWSTCKSCCNHFHASNADYLRHSFPREHLQPHGCRFFVHHLKSFDHLCVPQEDPSFGWRRFQHRLTGKPCHKCPHR
jgi:predicted MFS family arabinose efflux permease